MRLSAHLPHALWREIIAMVVYLYNRTPKHSLDWKSPYEAFHEVTIPAEGVTGPRKPTLQHLKAYGCRSYVLIKSARDPDKPKKRQKLRPKAHISFLVGYESTNIYRIRIPHKKKVISARDVLFDEEEFYDRKLLSSHFTIGESIGMEKIEYIELCVKSIYVKRWEGPSYREPPTAIVKAPEPGPQGLRPNFGLRI